MASAQTALPYQNNNPPAIPPARRTSLSSFPPPSPRPGSHMSHYSRPSRSPIPQGAGGAAGPAWEGDHTSKPNFKPKTPSIGTVVSSQHSSLSGSSAVPVPRYNADIRSSRKLKPQYPHDSTYNHVEYILVASFDIDRGPVMEHQFPMAITGGDEHMLAELMLPDGAHMRNQDWTIFFLHKDTSQEEEDEQNEEKKERVARRRRRLAKDRTPRLGDGEIEKGHGHGADTNGEQDDSDFDDDDSINSEPEGSEGPPLIYVLNLVNTKQDKTVKRGAVVKAMAICTRHPFLHIYKPLLLLALEEYFKSPVPETLAMLYDSVNAMDLSLMPTLSFLERQLLQSSENKDLFVEKFEQMVQQRIEGVRDGDSSEQSLDEAPRRPEIQRAGTKAFLEGKALYSIPRDTHEFESKVMYKGIPIPIKVPVAVMPESVGDFSLIKLIQNFSEPHAKSPRQFLPHPHLTTNGVPTHPIIVLANALLTQKRIIFLGHNMPSGEVAEAVLAACALASGGVLRGFTRFAFPYTDLTKIDDLLKIPGFIAGVTNPTFEHHPEWWDLLCDLPKGRMTISTKIGPAVATEGLLYFQQQNPSYLGLINISNINSSVSADLTGDQAFMMDVLKSIAARHGERVIRAKWRDWVVKFTRIAAAFEENVYEASAMYFGGDDGVDGATGTTQSIGAGGLLRGHGYVWPDEISRQKELAGNATRIEGWRNTRSYYNFIQDMAKIYTVKPLKGLDLHHLHDRLRMQRLTQSQTREIYLGFSKHVHSYDEICLLLSVMPESHAGLFYLALGLFHKDSDVRVKVAELLDRIGKHEAGQHWWKGMSRFEKLAYMRIRRDMEAEMKIKSSGNGTNPAEKRATG